MVVGAGVVDDVDGACARLIVVVVVGCEMAAGTGAAGRGGWVLAVVRGGIVSCVCGTKAERGGRYGLFNASGW